MLESVKRWAWVFAIAMSVATFGGFLSLRDIINGRIDAKVQEKESDIQKLRDNVIQAVADFKFKATEAISELSQHKKILTEETSKLHTDMIQAVSTFRNQTEVAIIEINKNKEEVRKSTLLSAPGIRNQSQDVFQ
jgi:hypothetical protein